MAKRELHKILAIILLGVFMLHTTPREFLHLFAGHQDTIDQIDASHAPDGLTISTAHQHCGFLQIGIEPYEHIRSVYTSPVQQIVWTYLQPFIPVCTITPHHAAGLRAPPFC
ncbi:hypothetical protein KTO58_28235 [Chitinophaga pendula]|uniref:hypothetical protein n=1 Tax=Chitinophaga TaxID=79328 RepID=UPI0012FD51F2|nr:MULTISPECIES: hypothetical protein [Chitinophaga]UCJ07502.1 hypothetical protein KTO58_28235 [Chitinophaga pendula]